MALCVRLLFTVLTSVGGMSSQCATAVKKFQEDAVLKLTIQELQGLSYTTINAAGDAIDPPNWYPTCSKPYPALGAPESQVACITGGACTCKDTTNDPGQVIEKVPYTALLRVDDAATTPTISQAACCDKDKMVN